jgi:hypothetical protein
MINLRDNIWAVEVPSMAFGFDVNNYGNSSEYMYMLDVADIIDETHHDETLIAKPLPPGTWEIVCTSKEASVAHAAKIVEEVEGGYKGYNTREDNVLFWREPIDSFYSILASKGCDLNKTYLILKNTA